MSDYILTSDRIEGEIELRFVEGRLNAIKMQLKQPLNEAQFRALVGSLPQFEGDMPKLGNIGLTVTLEIPTNEKLAMFCRLYLLHKGVKYNVSAKDSGQIKLVKVNEPVLVFYFNSSKFLFKDKHSVSNYVKYNNELFADFAASNKPQTTAHPDYFDQAYQNKLTAKELPSYWAHLRALGMQPKKDGAGNVTDWYRPLAT